MGLPNIMQLERKLHRMQTEMESLEWNQKKLQERFQLAVKECKMMEMLLAELEEEHDLTIAKIENLEGKVNIAKNMILSAMFLKLQSLRNSNLCYSRRATFIFCYYVLLTVEGSDKRKSSAQRKSRKRILELEKSKH